MRINLLKNNTAIWIHQRIEHDNQEQQLQSGDTGDNPTNLPGSDPEDQSTPDPKKKKKKLEPIELSPELQYLQELLQEDMQEMLIKPLEVRITKLESSHDKLEKQGETSKS